MDIGAPELLIVLVVALLFIGPRKLPQIARSIGAAIHELRASSRPDGPSNDVSRPARSDR